MPVAETTPVAETMPIREPGGVWLIAIMMPQEAQEAALAWLRTRHPTQSITLLLAQSPATRPLLADELWVLEGLGLRGFLALIRRAAWRHFECVYEWRPSQSTAPPSMRHSISWLKWFIWPRPLWYDICFHIKSGQMRHLALKEAGLWR